MTSNIVIELKEALEDIVHKVGVTEACRRLGRSSKWVYSFLEGQNDGVRVEEGLENGLLHYGYMIQLVKTEPVDLFPGDFKSQWEQVCKKLNPKAWEGEK